MSDKDAQDETRSLGAFLRDQREQKGVSIEAAIEATKISKPVLEAIETDNFDRMPAEAFCRGFYTIYANFLELDTKEIIARYKQARGITESTSTRQPRPPVLKSQKLGAYAEISPTSPVGGTTVLITGCLLLFAGICWYFNWNPMDSLSSIIMPQQTITVPAAINEDSKPAVEESTNTTIPSTTVTPTEADTDKLSQIPAMTLYNLQVTFQNSGMLKVTMDDGFVLDKQFSAGETLQWEVTKKIILDMPETAAGKLNLNGIEIPLPAAINGRRKLTLPEDLLD